MKRSANVDASPSRRRVLKAALAAPACGSAFLRIGSALAAYPDRPIKIVVANTPGGPSDIIARIMAAAMQQVHGRLGVRGEQGRRRRQHRHGLCRARRAGRLHHPAHHQRLSWSIPASTTRCPTIRSRISWRSASSAVSPHVFAVKADLGVKTMKEFVALAKANPDKFNVSTPPIGTTPQLQAEVLKLREGLAEDGDRGVRRRRRRAQGAAHRHGAALAPARSRPRIPHIKAGTIKGAGAVTGATRWHDLPDVPTMVEAGYKDFVFDTYSALMAPAKMPPEIVAKLEKVALDILAKPEMREKLTEAGFEVTAKDGKGHMARIAKEVPMFSDIIEQAGIKKL